MALEFRPDYAKIVELLLYLAHRKPGTDKYQAVKFFYLADRLHINRYGRPITYETYYALPYGPVASGVKDLLERDRITMRRAEITSLPFDVESVERQGPDQQPLSVLGKPHRDVDFDVFSKSDIRAFDEILKEFGNKSFDELYNVTHRHDAYKKAWANRKGMKRSLMRYEDMIEDADRRAAILADIGPVSANL